MPLPLSPPYSELTLTTSSQNVEVSNELLLYLVLSEFCCQALFWLKSQSSQQVAAYWVQKCRNGAVSRQVWASKNYFRKFDNSRSELRLWH